MKLLALLCILCFVLSSAVCNKREKYLPSFYTKKEVQCLYYQNLELFDSLVTVISSNETFYEKGRINEYTDADIVSPYDDEVSLFNDTDRETIDAFFELKPYMILYDYARRFVEITFYASDIHDGAYTLVFWLSKGENSEAEFYDYKMFLAQRYVLEGLDSHCFMFYKMESL